MSSPLEQGDPEKTDQSPKEVPANESCSSSEPPGENETVDCDLDVSSVSLIVQPSSSYNESNQDTSFPQLRKLSLLQDSNTSTELEVADDVTSECEVSAPLVGDIHVSVSLDSAGEVKSDDPTKNTSLNQLDSDMSVLSVSGEPVGSGESIVVAEPHISIAGRQNATLAQSIGDTSIEGGLLGEKQVSAGLKGSDKSPAESKPRVDVPRREVNKRGLNVENPTLKDQVSTKPEVESVVTIMKPKTQMVSTEQVARVQSESSAQGPKKKSFFLEDIVSGRLDLGENAEALDDLIYWRNPKKTGLIFVVGLAMLLSMQFYSLISVVAYVSLVLLAGGFVNRLCSSSQQCVNNPLMNISDTLSEENLKEFTDLVVYYVNDAVLAIRRLYLVEDVMDSIKFGLVLWYLTYVGLWFNGMTIVTICFVTIFTLPNFYMLNKQKIDDNVAIFWGKWLDLSTKARTVSQESLARILKVEGTREKIQ